MFEDDDNDDHRDEKAISPVDRAKDKSDEFRMHAELAAVFEGARKYNAQILPDLSGNTARDLQRTIGKLEKAKSADSPVLPETSNAEAIELLNFPATEDISTNDYHIHRRPGEVMIVRFLAGEEVDTFYTRLQAHFDAALGAFREEEKQQLAWKQDPTTAEYLKALDDVDIKLADRYLRDPIKQLKVFVLSTQTADEMDILHLTNFLMSISAEELVGESSAPPEDGATESDRAWFFKLFSLRGIVDDVERMCFFTYLQKADGDDW